MIAPRRIRFTVPMLALAALLAVGLAACSVSAASQGPTSVEGVKAAASPDEAVDVISVSGDIDVDSEGSTELVPDSYEDLAS